MVDSSLAAVLSWTLIAECPIPQDISSVLADGEVAHVAFSTLRDAAVFTNKRLIIRDAQGITGKKVEMYSIPYSSINMWSSENAGRLMDMNAELELWTKSGRLKLNIGKNLDVRAIDRLISNCVLGA
ncbi:PH domain-containing protein [Rothia nasimurium]|uniref:PH domain-containing protein n=1 Tax=Rothia nasimurium TaxID=85336 RepID=UPI001F1FFF77|nr:PH domain-containing protein [Rothia nasimurium]